MGWVIDAALVSRALALAEGSGRRVIIGITGEPGSGKSTVGAELVTALGTRAVLVPMDGFHLAQRVLDALGRADRKGAPDTFDADGFVATLTRIRAGSGTIYAPAFERSIEEPIAAAILVPPEADIVVTEGNYLLLDDDAWKPVRDLLDECWYLDADPVLRRQRLIERHIRFGRTAEAAEAWVDRTDEANAAVIRGTRARADHWIEAG